MRGPGNRSQSETLGVVLLLGMTVISVGALAAFGGVAIDDARHSVDVRSAEHALSQLDSKVSLVALSDGDRQSVALGRGRQGTYTVRPDAGRIVVTHVNYTDGNDSELYNETMGEIRYETDGTTLAYQGGGVWRSQSGGGSTMVSTPELHFRDMTLTMPLVRIDGDGSIGGSATADISSPTGSRAVYPNASENASYPDGTPLANPVQNGTIQIAVQSEYYRAWGSYFETRTDGNVTVYPENETAVVELVSIGAYGDFDMPMDEQAIELRALSDGHPLSNLTVTIASDQPPSQGFTHLSWSMYAKSGNQKFEIQLSTGANTGCNDNVAATVFYENETANQGWHDDDAFQVSCGDVDDDGEKEPRITANLTGNNSVRYGEVKDSEILLDSDSKKDFANPVTFDEHSDTTGWEETFHKNDMTTLGNVTNHYVGLMGPNVDLKIKDGHSEDDGNDKSSAGNINEDISSGYIKYGRTGKYVTYLHISENNVTIDLE